MNKSLKELIEAEIGAGQLELPVFNRTALKIQKLTRSSATTIEQITSALKEDPALATRLLTLANSAFYAGLKKVETVSAAVVRLGTQRVAKLAVVAGQSLSHQARQPLIARRMPDLWKRSFACAVGAEWLVRECGIALDAEAAFLSGLLHDVGELYLLQVIDKLMQQSDEIAGAGAPLIDEVVMALHCKVGHDVMLKWDIPEPYARVALAHQDDEFDTADSLLAVTRLMDRVCAKLGIGLVADPGLELAATLEAQSLELGEITLARLEVHLEDAIAAVGQLA